MKMRQAANPPRHISAQAAAALVKSGMWLDYGTSLIQPDVFDKALAARKEHKPKGSAQAMASAMGIELLTEEQYWALQAQGEFDTKTSSWIATPPDVRALGGALLPLYANFSPDRELFLKAATH